MALRNRIWSDRVQRESRARGESIFLRFGLQYVIDAAAWTIAITASFFFRYDFVEARVHWLSVILLCLVVIALQLVLGWIFWVYRGRFTYSSFEEARAVAITVLVIVVVTTAPIVLFSHQLEMPRSIMLISGPFAYALMGGARYVKRMYVIQQSRPRDEAKPAILMGAGSMGSLMVRRMLTDRDSDYVPVAFLDDDRSKRNLQLMGIPVRGTFDDIVKVANATNASVLVVCVAQADAHLLQRISAAAEPIGLRVKVLPELDDVRGGRTNLKDVRDLSIEDLIGRHPVDTDVATIADYLPALDEFDPE